MIIDAHAHTFPDLGTAPGFAEPAEFFRLLQRGLAFHGQPPRRLSDHAVMPDAPPPWRLDDPSPAGWLAADFRPERFGRFAWTIDGVTYYRQYLPAWLEPIEAGADLIVALMDAIGVDRCVLQNDSYYGKLNDFFGDCVRRHPTRFIGTIHIDEDRADADASLAELERAAGGLGLRGLFFGPHQYWLHGHGLPLDDDRLGEFWATVERLGLVVYWALSGGPLRDEAGYLDQARRVGRVLDRHPTLGSVLVGGVPNRYFDDPAAALPPELAALAAYERLCFEVTFPISVGRVEDYPFPSAQRSVRRLYDRLGPRKLVWGSDLPNVERHCTYAQSLTYLTRHCAFIPPDDLALIIGGNLARLFDLA